MTVSRQGVLPRLCPKALQLTLEPPLGQARSHRQRTGLRCSRSRNEEQPMATIAALFADPGRAEGALQALMTAGLSGHRTALIRPEVYATEMTPFRDPAGSGAVRPGALAGVPAEDRAAFEAGLRRGGSVLVAEIAGDLQEAIRIVETFEPADLDGRTEEAQRRQGGDTGMGGGVDVGAPLGAGLT